MREIKFRAWCKLDKVMLTTDKEYKDFAEKNNENYWELKCGNFSDIYLLQYTGFKDKKGKEVYEGDIMNCYEKGFDYPQILVVGFSEGQYMLYNPNCCSHCKNQNGCVCSLGESCYYEYEIIGNIHQNYDLLPLKSEK